MRLIRHHLGLARPSATSRLSFIIYRRTLLPAENAVARTLVTDVVFHDHDLCVAPASAPSPRFEESRAS